MKDMVDVVQAQHTAEMGHANQVLAAVSAEKDELVSVALHLQEQVAYAQQEVSEARTIVQKVTVNANEHVRKQNEDFQQAAQIYQGDMKEIVETQVAALQENHMYDKEQALAVYKHNLTTAHEHEIAQSQHVNAIATTQALQMQQKVLVQQGSLEVAQMNQA